MEKNIDNTFYELQVLEAYFTEMFCEIYRDNTKLVLKDDVLAKKILLNFVNVELHKFQKELKIKRIQEEIKKQQLGN